MPDEKSDIENSGFQKIEWRKFFTYKWVVKNIPFFLFLPNSKIKLKIVDRYVSDLPEPVPDVTTNPLLLSPIFKASA